MSFAAPPRLLDRAISDLWQRELLPHPSLDPAELTAYAERKERADDFGGEHWREPLTALCRSLEHEAMLSPFGRTIACGQIVKLLRDRLRLVRLWRRHPEILDQPLAPPVIVLGSMRSGTTRVQRLLACNTAFEHTRLFESINPAPALGRRLRTSAGLAVLHRIEPTLGRIHPTGSSQPDEEFGFLSLSFNGAQFETQWRVPSFARLWELRDKRPVYQDFRHVLQTLAWQRGVTHRPWILKVPQFMEDLDALLAAFPGARLVCLHRDAEPVVGSSASLVWHQMRMQSDHVDPAWVGREWLRKTRRRVERARAVRAEHHQVPQIDVKFADVSVDWRREMGRIHEFLGLPLDPSSERRMARYLAGANAHHGHRYRLSDFGLSGEEVAAALPHGA